MKQLSKSKMTLLATAVLVIVVGVIALTPQSSYAQYNAQPVQFDPGENALKNSGLSDTNAVTITINIINWTLGLLALIAVVLIIYAGVTWMTSGGNEDAITRAKDILKAAFIGLIIILASYGIVVFVLDVFIEVSS